jgi:hypothetical protein
MSKCSNTIPIKPWLTDHTERLARMPPAPLDRKQVAAHRLCLRTSDAEQVLFAPDEHLVIYNCRGRVDGLIHRVRSENLELW